MLERKPGIVSCSLGLLIKQVRAKDGPGPEDENFPVHVLNSGHSTRGTVTWPDSLLAAKPAELLSVC